MAEEKKDPILNTESPVAKKDSKPVVETQKKERKPKVSVVTQSSPTLEDLLSRAFRVTTNEGGSVNTSVQRVDDLINTMFSEPEMFTVRFESKQDFNVVREAVERVEVFDGRVTVTDERRAKILNNLDWNFHNT